MQWLSCLLVRLVPAGLLRLPMLMPVCGLSRFLGQQPVRWLVGSLSTGVCAGLAG